VATARLPRGNLAGLPFPDADRALIALLCRVRI